MSGTSGILKYVSSEHLARKIDFQGPVPSTKEVYRRALNIAWPSAAETVLVSLVGSVDTIMVGGSNCSGGTDQSAKVYFACAD